jgi:hypothetical protein
MMRTIPFRLITLHLSQMRLTLVLTFITVPPYGPETPLYHASGPLVYLLKIPTLDVAVLGKAVMMMHLKLSLYLGHRI